MDRRFNPDRHELTDVEVLPGTLRNGDVVGWFVRLTYTGDPVREFRGTRCEVLRFDTEDKARAFAAPFAETLEQGPAPITLGTWVRDQFDRTGRVTALHTRCPESDSWLNRQEWTVTTEHVRSPWVSILIDGGGSVSQPISTVEAIADPGRPLDNLWTDHHFPQGATA